MQQPEAAARRRADVVARSQDVGRDHGAPRRRRRATRGIPVLVNMHDVELARRFADRIVGMSGGRVVYDGPPAGSHRRRAEADLRRRGLAALSHGRHRRAATLRIADPFAPQRRGRASRLDRCSSSYVVYACAQMEISWERVVVGLDNAQHFLAPHVPAELRALGAAGQGTARKPGDRGARVGARHRARAADRPAAARNLMPAWVTWPARALIVARALVPSGDRRDPVRQGGRLRRAGRHPRADRRVDRLHRQALRRSDRGDLAQAGRGGPRDGRAVHDRASPSACCRRCSRASSASRTYQLDSNLRNSTMVGIVGAGGIGGTLFAAFQRFDYDYVCAILISIIALIMLGELLRHRRARDLHRQRDAARPVPCAAAAAPRAIASSTMTDVAAPLEPLHARAAPGALRGLPRRSSRRSSRRCSTVEVIPEFLSDAPEQVVDLFARMWPVDWAHYPGSVHDALMETIHIASLGTLLALVLALPVGILAAHNLVPFAPINLAATLHPRVVALGQLARLGAAVRRHLRAGRAGRNARDRLSLDRLRGQAVRRSARGSAARVRSRR